MAIERTSLSGTPGPLAQNAAPPSTDVNLQRLWLGVQTRPWRSLAMLAASPSVDTMPLAELLARLAWAYRGQPSTVLDLRDLSLRLVEYHLREVRAQTEAGACVFIALRSTTENPTAIPMARSADAVVLCLGLGTSGLKSASQVLTDVGRERVLGAIVLKASRSKGSKRSKAKKA